VEKAAKEAIDAPKIRDFVAKPDITTTALDIGIHTVLFCAKRSEAAEGKQVAELCWKLWEWLGVKKPFTVVLWWRDDPRRLAADEWPSKATVNGGWTHQNSAAIYIYRKEEWDRVFLHEMIHALGWDWTMPEKPLACWGLPANSNTVPALFEAWTELYAEWLWCAWHARDYAAWKAQRAWQETQALQILARYKMLGMQSWHEDTSVFAYYVLKAALAPHMDQLLLFGNGDLERNRVLCEVASPALQELYAKAEQVKPVSMSLRMSKEQSKLIR
jgi:hypothetical protein